MYTIYGLLKWFMVQVQRWFNKFQTCKTRQQWWSIRRTSSSGDIWVLVIHYSVKSHFEASDEIYTDGKKSDLFFKGKIQVQTNMVDWWFKWQVMPHTNRKQQLNIYEWNCSCVLWCNSGIENKSNGPTVNSEQFHKSCWLKKVR